MNKQIGSERQRCSLARSFSSLCSFSQRSLSPCFFSLWANCLVGIAFAAFCSAPAQAQGQERLEFKPAVGQEFLLSFEQISKNKTTLLEKQIAMSIQMEMDLVWKVLEKNEEGFFEIEQTFERLYVRMESDNVDSIEYDSKGEEADLTGYAYEFSQAVKPLLQNPVTIVVSSRSEIIQVEIPPDTMDALRKAAGSMRLRQLFSRDGIEETLTGAMAVLPENPLASGESWEVKRNSKLPEGTLNQLHTYTLVGPEEREGKTLLRVDVESGLEFEAANDQIKKPLEIEEQDLSGVLWFDPETGMVGESEFTSKLTTITPYREHSLKTEGEQELKLKVQKR